MDVQAIRKVARKLMVDRRVHHEREVGGAFYHGERVANTSMILRKSILPDDSTTDDILTAAALFHDIGKGIEPHNEYGAVITAQAMKDFCTQEELEQILILIRLHSLRSPLDNNFSVYTKILQDADLLDHYGSFTLWMDFLNSAYEKKSIEQTFAYDDTEWDKHCHNSRNALNYDFSKAIFDEKIRFVNEFYKRFRIEGIGGIVIE